MLWVYLLFNLSVQMPLGWHACEACRDPCCLAQIGFVELKSCCAVTCRRQLRPSVPQVFMNRLRLPTGTDTSLTLGLNIAALKMAALIGRASKLKP